MMCSRSSEHCRAFCRQSRCLSDKGSRKATPFAAQLAATEVSKTGLEMGLTRVGVIVRGPGSGRESAIRAVNASGLKVTMIKDATPIPHNGCRPPKTRRI